MSRRERRRTSSSAGSTVSVDGRDRPAPVPGARHCRDGGCRRRERVRCIGRCVCGCRLATGRTGRSAQPTSTASSSLTGSAHASSPAAKYPSRAPTTSGPSSRTAAQRSPPVAAAGSTSRTANTRRAGGVSALRFSSRGELVDAYRILGGTQTNCAGGATPWRTCLSGEEHPQGAAVGVMPSRRNWRKHSGGHVSRVTLPDVGTVVRICQRRAGRVPSPWGWEELSCRTGERRVTIARVAGKR
jgi:Bacterial protein of unknown function (DUF839)